ncbi:MAG: DUF2490 domain-containing protein [Candidatus Obscuribacterales bacterium]|nr:DUF2490 domain-containing protein [Candidatus Obscuribacterales bacterium]
MILGKKPACKLGLVVKAAILLLAQLPLCDLTASPAAAQVEKDWGLWSPIYFNAPIRKRWWGYLELNPRINNNVQRFDQLLVRPAIGFRFLRNGYVYNGFCWISNYNIPGRIPANEYRIFQQALFNNEWNTRVGKFVITNRTRLEERLSDFVNGCAIRARHQVRGTYTIGKTNWYLAGSNELFINLNSLQTDIKSGFDQNRLYAGVGRNISKHTSVELGYQWQYVNRIDPVDDLGRSSVMVQIFNNWY